MVSENSSDNNWKSTRRAAHFRSIMGLRPKSRLLNLKITVQITHSVAWWSQPIRWDLIRSQSLSGIWNPAPSTKCNHLFPLSCIQSIHNFDELFCWKSDSCHITSSLGGGNDLSTLAIFLQHKFQNYRVFVKIIVNNNCCYAPGPNAQNGLEPCRKQAHLAYSTSDGALFLHQPVHLTCKVYKWDL